MYKIYCADIYCHLKFTEVEWYFW